VPLFIFIVVVRGRMIYAAKEPAECIVVRRSYYVVDGGG